MAGNWNDQWIFWVGPIGGAIVAAVVYETLLRDQSKSKVRLWCSQDSLLKADMMKRPS